MPQTDQSRTKMRRVRDRLASGIRLRLRGMPHEGMVAKFPQIVHGIESEQPIGR
jgi:hypothetical protein